MCGIYGYIGSPKHPNELYKMVRAMAIETESRGTDSSGIAAINDNAMYHIRDTVPATAFYQKNDIKHVIKQRCYFFLGHNRWASLGKVTKDNAHPFLGDKFLFAHNGTVPLAVDTTKQLNLHTDGETDSESLMILAEKYGLGSLKRFNNLSTVAIDYADKKGAMYFYRDFYNPMWICDIRDVANVILFASTKEILTKGIQAMTVMNDKHFIKRAVETKVGDLIKFDKDGNQKVIKTKYSSELGSTLNKIKSNIKIIRRRERKYSDDYKNYWQSVYGISGGHGKGCSLPYDETGLYHCNKV